jgi:hypothetical protein
MRGASVTLSAKRMPRHCDVESSGPDVRRLTAVFGLLSVALWLGQFPLYMQDDPSVSVYDGQALVRDFLRIQNVVFTSILLNLCAYVTGMVFAAGLRPVFNVSPGARR